MSRDGFANVHMLGNLTRDPEVRYTPKGTAVCSLSVAVNRSFKPAGATEYSQTTTFLDVTVWGAQAEAAGKVLQKGRPVAITGRLDQDEWTDKSSGEKRRKLTIICERWFNLGSPSPTQDRPPERENATSTQPARTESPAGPADAGSGDNIPF